MSIPSFYQVFKDGFNDFLEENPKIGTRSRSPLSPCRVASLDEGTLTAEFESPQFAPAPGQRLALYGGEVLAASGVIV